MSSSNETGILANDAILVKFDDIMVSLVGYQQDREKFSQEFGEVEGLQKAFNNWEGIARIIGYELLERAIKSRRNIIPRAKL